MFDKSHKAAYVALTYRQMLIAQIGAGLASNPQFQAKMILTPGELANMAIKFADLLIEQQGEGYDL